MSIFSKSIFLASVLPIISVFAASSAHAETDYAYCVAISKHGQVSAFSTPKVVNPITLGVAFRRELSRKYREIQFDVFACRDSLTTDPVLAHDLAVEESSKKMRQQDIYGLAQEVYIDVQ